MSKLLVLLVICNLLQLSIADFWFNKISSKDESIISEMGLKCFPGRTVIKLEEKTHEKIVTDSQESAEGDGDGDETNEAEAKKANQENEADESAERLLRFHTTVKDKDELCKICVCSAEGKDEYCSQRPARNVNECIRMSQLMGEFNKNLPYDHERDLSQRIRRDYIYHRDDILYDPQAKCYRGTSYYTNNKNAENTDIDVGSDIESPLNYDNKDLCYYCVCTVSGTDIKCLQRDIYFCDYLRFLNRDENVMRDVYTNMFKQDRASYFRLLSYRLRRSMEDGLFGLIQSVNLNKKLYGATGGPNDDSTCIPFVSHYSDCTEANQCIGCTRCTCSPDAKWVCNNVVDCPKKRMDITEDGINNAFSTLLYEMQFKDGSKKPKANKGREPDTKSEDGVLDYPHGQQAFLRQKRDTIFDDAKAMSKDVDDRNDTIKFYHTLDEINEDTLKSSNLTGTLEAKKVDMDHLLSRRTDILGHNSTSNGLHIDYSNTLQHIDNKIDGNQSDIALDLIGQSKLGIVTNHTQKEKDRDLSKLVVNELKSGTEFVGDKNAPIISNITFTPENDTLTAMAFIAGNLLNKLWSMEKDASDESMEIEALKTENLKDLLDLFKEPLTMRQEAFLKNALETLSTAIDKHRDTKNVSLCESINDAKKFIDEASNMTWEKSEVPEITEAPDFHKIVATDRSESKKDATVNAIAKLNHVMSLIKKYESVTKHLSDLNKPHSKNTVDNSKGKPQAKRSEKISKDTHLRTVDSDDDDDNISNNENVSINMFGKILEKITKLLLPYKKGNRMIHKIRNFHLFKHKDGDIKGKLRESINVDIGNLTMKDKMILDYLAKVKSNPKSLLADSVSNEVPSPYLEGDILLNLSEFFKIKSLMDLLKLINNDKPDKADILRTKNSTECISCKLHQQETKSDGEKSSDNEKVSNSDHSDDENTQTPTKRPKSITNIKDKLKSHLKTILDDLMELQNESGIPAKDGKLVNSIADAFPCIYNILKDDDVTNNTNKETQQALLKKSNDSYVKVAELYKDLKKEYSSKSVQGRRMDEDQMLAILKNTPVSTLVWERVIENIDESLRTTARRNTDIKTASSFDDIKTKIDDIEATTGSNAYKSYEKILEVPAADQMMLLLAIHADVRRYLEVLKDIKASYQLIETLPNEKLEIVKKFIDDAASSVGVDKKAIDAYNRAKTVRANAVQKIVESQTEPVPKFAKIIAKDQEDQTSHDKNIKLTRDEVLNQLIKNRVSLYLKMKQNRNGDFKDDPNYGIAKNIMTNLEHGNVKLARQLYKIFVTSKQENSVNTVNDKINEKNSDKHDKLHSKISDKAEEKFRDRISASFTDKLNQKLSHVDKLNTGYLSNKYSDKFNVNVQPPPIFPDELSQIRRQSILQKMPIVQFEDPRVLTNQLLAAQRNQMVRNVLTSKNFKVI